MNRAPLPASGLVLILALGCSDGVVALDDPRAGGVDAAAPDTGGAATSDVGAGDSLVPDAAPAPDLGIGDAGLPDVAPAPPLGVRDAGVLDATGADAQPSPAATIATECQVAADCDNLLPPPSVRWCPSSSWACVDGACAWECSRGGRTCTRDAAGCMRCDNEPAMSCPGDPCDFQLPMMRLNIEEATCARAFLAGPWTCYGDWFALDDGMLCSMEWLPTGALRAVLVCERCQTTYMF